jgi:hypothetical protein
LITFYITRYQKKEFGEELERKHIESSYHLGFRRGKNNVTEVIGFFFNGCEYWKKKSGETLSIVSSFPTTLPWKKNLFLFDRISLAAD